jgi:hypothetical protein
MKRISLFALFFITHFTGFSQQNFYWIKFKDKKLSPYSLIQPEQFLSAESIARRQTQNILLDESDLPISPAYIDSISPFINELRHRLKWFNTAVVQINVSANVAILRQLSFVDSIAPLHYLPYKSSLKKFEDEEALMEVNQNIVYPNYYGAAYHQANMINVDLLHQLGYKGQGVHIAVMDNGFYNTDIIPGFDSMRTNLKMTRNFVQNSDIVYARGSHGTTVLSCLAGHLPNRYLGTAPGADYSLFTTEQDDAEWLMEEYNWAAAAETADSIGAKILTTSLGYTTFDGDTGNHTYADLDGNTTIITRASNRAFNKGILVATSAGNSGTNSWFYISAPADADSALTIGAVDSAEVIAGFSSRGPNASGRIKPDLCTQGVKSAVITTDGGVGYSGGTSFSCPIFAGAAACLWQAFPDKSAQDIKDAILLSTDRFWNPDNNYGHGIPNFYTAYLLLQTNYNGNILQADQSTVVYPNPFDQTLNVATYSAENKLHRLEVFDITGSKVIDQEIFLRDKTYEIIALTEVRQLPAGKYILRLNRDKKQTFPLVKVK